MLSMDQMKKATTKGAKLAGSNRLDENGSMAVERLYDSGGDGALLSVADASAPGLAHSPMLTRRTQRRESIGDGEVMSARYLGHRVMVDDKGLGFLRFVGPSLTDGETVCGVELDAAEGDCDGLKEASLTLP